MAANVSNVNIPRSAVLDAKGELSREWRLYLISLSGNSGTFTPVLTGVANVASSTAPASQFMRVGNMLTVSGQLTVLPTAAGVLTQIDIPLPVQSNFTNAYQVSGTAVVEVAGTPGYITGHVATHNALLSFTPVTGAAAVIDYMFTYQVLV